MRKSALYLAAPLFVALVGCSRGDDASTSSSSAEITTKETAWTIERNARLGTPMLLAAPRGTGPKLLARQADVAAATKATIDFLDAHRDMLRMKAPRAQLMFKHGAQDELAMTHIRLAQIERGVPVVGGEVYAHYDREGRLTSVQDGYVPDLDKLDVTPAIDGATAQREVLLDAIGGAQVSSNLELVGEPRLIVSATQATATSVTPARLSWEVGVRRVSGVGEWLVTIDATTRSVLDHMSRIQTLKGSGIALSGERKNLEVLPVPEQTGVFGLMDESRPTQIYTFDAKDGTDYAKTTLVTSTTTTAWDTAAASGRGAAVDAQVLTGIVVDFYKKTLGRKGLDDKDTRIQNIVHYDKGMDNAFYTAQNDALHYGDGSEKFLPLAGALDVTAHEFTHGVTEYTSGLRYQGQSGALNESMSDVFGAVIENSARPDPKKNWLIGEGFVKAGGALRDMINPGAVPDAQPSHMDELVNTTQDNGGVHINSGIPNKAAHLMTEGGTHPLSKVKVEKGIGFEKTAKVWYRANQRYLIATSDFALAAKATMEAATDLKLTQTELDTIDCAWKAVGVVKGDCVTPASNKPTTPESTEPTTDDDTESEKTEGTKIETQPDEEQPKKKAETAVTQSSGCAAAPQSSQRASFSIVGLAAALAMVIRRTRRTRGASK